MAKAGKHSATRCEESQRNEHSENRGRISHGFLLPTRMVAWWGYDLRMFCAEPCQQALVVMAYFPRMVGGMSAQNKILIDVTTAICGDPPAGRSALDGWQPTGENWARDYDDDRGKRRKRYELSDKFRHAKKRQAK